MQFPVTIIVRHPRENPKKCSILPLQGRENVRIVSFPPTEPLSLEGYIRLAAEGPELSPADRDRGVLLLDGSWRSATRMIKSYEHVPPRSLSGWRTAYPRVSRLGTDPDNGLASVEALYIAYHILGRSTEGLLDHYRWKSEFLGLNANRFDACSPDAVRAPKDKRP
jgi:pre-rRNA-processing protein TSR3